MHVAPVELITKSVEAGLVYRTDLFFETAILAQIHSGVTDSFSACEFRSGFACICTLIWQPHCLCRIH